jgi:hypothetical protein
MTGQSRRGMALTIAGNKILGQLRLKDRRQHRGSCQMWCGCERASIVFATPVWLMLRRKPRMTGGRTGVAVHRAYDECGTWLAANIGHPAGRQKRTQNHRGKREMNCQVTQIAGHISSAATLMRESACRQDEMLPQLEVLQRIGIILTRSGSQY